MSRTEAQQAEAEEASLSEPPVASQPPPPLPRPASLFESLLARGKFGGYAPMQVLGRGAEGAVVLLRSSDGAHVVSEQIRLDPSFDQTQLSRIETEVALLQRSAHPRVIEHHAVFFAMGTINIIQQFASGGTLAEAILRQQGSPTPRLSLIHGEAPLRSSDRSTPFAPRRVWRWMGEVVGALRHMHSLRVVHRDLSSTNLLIDEHDGIKLSDFGNAAQLPPVGPMAREDRTIGTPYYMSPQAVRSEPPSGGETDVWSFGVVCFELLTLQRPFRAQSYEALAPLIVAGAYDKAALHASPHDAALCALVTSDALLHVDVERRATLAHVDKVLDSLAHLYAEPEVPADALAEEAPGMLRPQARRRADSTDSSCSAARAAPARSGASTPASTAGPGVTPPTGACSTAVHSLAATPRATPLSSSPDGTSMPPSIRRRSKSVVGCDGWSSSARLSGGATGGGSCPGSSTQPSRKPTLEGLPLLRSHSADERARQAQSAGRSADNHMRMTPMSPLAMPYRPPRPSRSPLSAPSAAADNSGGSSSAELGPDSHSGSSGEYERAHSSRPPAMAAVSERLEGDNYDGLSASTQAMAMTRLGSPTWATPLAAPRPRTVRGRGGRGGAASGEDPPSAAAGDVTTDAAGCVDDAEDDVAPLEHTTDTQGGSAADAGASGDDSSSSAGEKSRDASLKFVRRSQHLVLPLFAGAMPSMPPATAARLRDQGRGALTGGSSTSSQTHAAQQQQHEKKGPKEPVLDTRDV